MSWFARNGGRALGVTWLVIVVVFIYAPIVAIIGASVDPGDVVRTSSFLQFPPRGFTLHWYLVIEPSLWQSVWTSLRLALVVTLGAVVVGVPAALGLVRGTYRGRSLVASLFRAPLQIPFIVVGVAVLQTYYWLGSFSGLRLQASLLGLFVAHLFIATPFVISAVGSSLAQISPRLEEAALSLGASRWRAFRRVTLPLIVSGIFGGALYAFLISFTDATITIFLQPAGESTFPVWVYYSTQNDLRRTVPAISLLVFLASILLIFALQKLVGMEAVLRGGGGRSA